MGSDSYIIIISLDIDFARRVLGYRLISVRPYACPIWLMARDWQSLLRAHVLIIPSSKPCLCILSSSSLFQVPASFLIIKVYEQGVPRGGYRGRGSDKALQLILAPHLAPPSFKVPLKSNILQFPSYTSKQFSCQTPFVKDLVVCTG